MGAWIETGLLSSLFSLSLSLPIWERGLKLKDYPDERKYCFVAPYMGAWIETYLGIQCRLIPYVAPYMGAWIETFYVFGPEANCAVAPYMGAWIETR